ncbi:MAG TPA: hypothetical protein VD930_07540 [Gemmatimonadales bacterium]|nr:hypothetical protein [Gemmatimonadales bacterium]
MTALSALSAASALFAPLSAQTVRVSGQVIKADSNAIAETSVVLHRIGQTAQGPIDSTRTDRRGRFRFSYRPDSATFYLASSRYAGIEYFSTPLPTNPARPDSSIQIVVYDTSSTARVELEARHLVVTRPAEDGSRGVLDLIMLRNDGRHTRIAPDTLGSSWSAPLPRGSAGLEVGESDVSAETISRRGDSLFVGAAIAPGEKQMTLQYQVPSRVSVLELPLDPGSALVNVMVEEPGVRVTGPGLQPADSQVIQGRSFRRWTGNVSAGGVLRIVLPGASPLGRWILPALVGVLGLGLIAAAWLALAGRRDPTMDAHRTQLLDAIAMLDLRYQGKREQVSEEEWSSYLVERARLKQHLESALAGGQPSR